jgi:hypothetical protein
VAGLSGGLRLLSCSAKAEHPVTAASDDYCSHQCRTAAITGSSACADDDNYATFSPTKSVSSLRVISGANQMNSGASIRNDRASKGSPVAME